MKIATVIGARPEIIKMSRLVPLLDKNFDHTFIFTGQHYSKAMVDIFFEDLGLRQPDFSLNTMSSDYHVLMESILGKLKEVNPDYVVVYGDTNSTLATAICAKKLNKKLIHIEAGLRSFDKEMPEEMNRILTDHVSDFLFTPTEYTKRLLKNEGIIKNVFVVGNPVIDTVVSCSSKVDGSSILNDLGLEEGEYFLLTLHRCETVDNPEKIKKLIGMLASIDRKIVFPIHPRTEKALKEFNLTLPENVIKTGPLGYFDFLRLLKSSFLVMTDSGGVQEEAVALRVPCLTLRNFTERMEIVELGVSFLVGIEPDMIRQHIDYIINNNVREKLRQIENPYGVGKTSESIIEILKQRL